MVPRMHDRCLVQGRALPAVRKLVCGTLFLTGMWLQAAGCGPLFPNVMEPTDIPTLREGSPRIRGVRDMGAVHIGKAGPLAAESDGAIHVGELLLIEGSGFGKGPTVAIAGRPAEVRWRTEGGGIVVQVPAGCAVGPQRLSVQNGDGRDEVPVTLQRLAAVLDPRRGELYALRVGNGAPTTAGPALRLGSPGSQPLGMAMSPDGVAAYVLLATSGKQGTPTGEVVVVDLVAPGGPRVADTRKLRHRAHSITAAERAGVLAMVGDEQVTLWDINEARRPAAWQPSNLPAAAQKAWTAALHPGGTLLAMAMADSNDVVLVDVALVPDKTGIRPRELAVLNALPEARQPLLNRLRFASDGETLWLTSGDNAMSLGSGHQPTRLTALGLSHGATQGGSATGDAAPASKETDVGLAVLKTVELKSAGAPIDLALGRRPPVSSGTTIRMPPERAAVFVSTVAGLAGAGGGGEKIRGSLARGDLAGGLKALSAGDEIVAGLDVSPGAEIAVSARIRPGDGQLSLAVTDLLSGGDVTTALGTAQPAVSDGKADGGRAVWQLSQVPVALQP